MHWRDDSNPFFHAVQARRPIQDFSENSPYPYLTMETQFSSWATFGIRGFKDGGFQHPWPPADRGLWNSRSKCHFTARDTRGNFAPSYRASRYLCRSFKSETCSRIRIHKRGSRFTRQRSMKYFARVFPSSQTSKMNAALTNSRSRFTFFAFRILIESSMHLPHVVGQDSFATIYTHNRSN